MITFPTRIATKREAFALAGELFPPHPAEVDRIKRERPDAEWPLPLFSLSFEHEERLRALLDWLYDDAGRMRIYKRCRHHLFWALVKNFLKFREDNQVAIDRHYNEKTWRKEWARQRAAILFDQGAGI